MGRSLVGSPERLTTRGGAPQKPSRSCKIAVGCWPQNLSEGSNISETTPQSATVEMEVTWPVPGPTQELWGLLPLPGAMCHLNHLERLAFLANVCGRAMGDSKVGCQLLQGRCSSGEDRFFPVLSDTDYGSRVEALKNLTHKKPKYRECII